MEFVPYHILINPFMYLVDFFNEPPFINMKIRVLA